MLNTNIRLSPNYNNNLNFEMPAVCMGTLQKSRACSHFTRFHSKSPMAKYMFPDDGHARLDRVVNDFGRIDKERTEAECPEVEILQIMCFGDGELLVEYAFKKDLYGEEQEDE